MYYVVGVLLVFFFFCFGRFFPKLPNKIKSMYCKIGWHSPGHLWQPTSFDGCSVHATCPWCNYEGMIDSQGNLF